MFRASSAHLQEVNDVKLYMYAATGIVLLCGWPSCAIAKGRLNLPLATAQDGHLQRRMIPVAAYIYNFTLLTS
jgi:hypothetical protein